IGLSRQAADLDLAAGHAGVSQPGHLARQIGESLALLVIAGDGDDRQAIAVAAEQGRDSGAERFAEQVPQRGVDTGDRLHDLLAVAIGVGEREHPRPQPLDMAGVLADQQRRQLVLDDRGDVAALLLLALAAMQARAGDFTDAAGRRVVLPAEPRHVMAASPTAEVLVSVLATDKLAGASRAARRGVGAGRRVPVLGWRPGMGPA